MYAGSTCCRASRARKRAECERRISTAASDPCIEVAGQHAHVHDGDVGHIRSGPSTGGPAHLSRARRRSGRRRRAAPRCPRAEAHRRRRRSLGARLWGRLGRRLPGGVTSPRAMNECRGGGASVERMRASCGAWSSTVASILAQTERPVEVYEATLEAIGTGAGLATGRSVEGRPRGTAAALREDLA